jgi:hypothetical protein
MKLQQQPHQRLKLLAAVTLARLECSQKHTIVAKTTPQLTIAP